MPVANSQQIDLLKLSLFTAVLVASANSRANCDAISLPNELLRGVNLNVPVSVHAVAMPPEELDLCRQHRPHRHPSRARSRIEPDHV